MVEIAHHPNAVAFAVAADRGGVGQLAEEERLATIERLHDQRRLVGNSDLTQLGECVKKNLTDFLVAQLRLPVECRNIDDADGSQLSRRFQGLFDLVETAGPFCLVVRDEIAVARPPTNGGRFKTRCVKCLFVFSTLPTASPWSSTASQPHFFILSSFSLSSLPG